MITLSWVTLFVFTKKNTKAEKTKTKKQKKKNTDTTTSSGTELFQNIFTSS